jgi:predicted MFS family arabinose efflux permease
VPASWAELLPLFLGIFAVATNLFLVVPLLPAIRQDFPGQSFSDLGQLLVSAYALPYALLAPALGPVSDRLGRVPIMVAGMAVLGVSALTSALAANVVLLAAARGAAGIGAALFTPAAYAYIGDRYAYRRRERVLALVLAGLPVATIVGVPAAGLVAAMGSWRWGMVMVAGIASVAGLAVLRLPSSGLIPQTRYWSLLAEAGRDGRAMMAVAVSFLWFVAGLGLFTYMGQYLSSLFGFGPRARALAVGAYGVTGLLGSWAGVRFAARRGKRAAVVWGMIVLAGVFLLIAFNRSSGVLALVALAGWGAASWFGMPSLQAIVSELRPTARGTLLAINTSAMYLGATLGAAVMGRALDLGGFTAAGLLAASVVAAGALIAALGVRERPSPPVVPAGQPAPRER